LSIDVYSYKFDFPTPDDQPSGPIISFSDASFGYPGGPLLFKDLNFGIDLDSRLASEYFPEAPYDIIQSFLFQVFC
jgi:ATPase subunit of ABC transporter with duplicated ATPase domains